MYREDGERTDNIYENDVIRGKTRKDSMRGKSSELTESDSVIRNYRSAVVCLVLLCVLLLTAVIVLCVIFMHEKQQLISKNEKLRSNNEKLINETEQLILKNTNLTNDRDQLILKNSNLTNDRDQLILKNSNLTNERDQLILKNSNLINERDQLRDKLQICVGWTCYNSSFYYMSNEMKSWTESRNDCQNRGADLIIINDRQEKDFVNNMTGAAAAYIGLTDIDNEGTWKWLDGTLTSGPWSDKEPNGGTRENCAVTVRAGWADEPCDRAYQWICEKRISQLILP